MGTGGDAEPLQPAQDLLVLLARALSRSGESTKELVPRRPEGGNILHNLEPVRDDARVELHHSPLLLTISWERGSVVSGRGEGRRPNTEKNKNKNKKPVSLFLLFFLFAAHPTKEGRSCLDPLCFRRLVPITPSPCLLSLFPMPAPPTPPSVSSILIWWGIIVRVVQSSHTNDLACV